METLFWHFWKGSIILMVIIIRCLGWSVEKFQKYGEILKQVRNAYVVGHEEVH